MTLKCLRVNRTETIDLNEQKSSRLTRTNACGFWLVLGTCNVSSELKVIFWFSCRYFARYSTTTTTTTTLSTLSTLSNQAEMPDWKQNKFEGVYKFGAAYLMQKRYEILKDIAATGSFFCPCAWKPQHCTIDLRQICNDWRLSTWSERTARL